MDRHTSSSSGIPAPYGHACANCAQSKCKCIVRRAGGPCERCRRLNKECHPAETVRRRNPRRPAVSKTARLEEKLDGLMSLIKVGAQSGAVITFPQAAAVVDDSTPYGTTRINADPLTHNQPERDLESSSSNDYIHNAPVLTPATDGSTSSSYNIQPSDFRDIGGEPSLAEAEEYLMSFQTYKSKYFPFIYIASTTSAQQLRQDRPFLWLSIMAVGSKSTSQQQVLESKIRQTIAQEMLVQSGKDIDLLLGLLTFMGWAHFQIYSKCFLTLFTQLAISLVFDLGLNKSVPKDTQVLPCVKEKYSKPTTPRTMEERRAVLGCFLVTSVVSSFLQKIDALRWTPHMDECLQVLEERKECLNDEILVQQVQLQLIVEKIALGKLHDGAIESTERTGEPLSLYLETSHSQLQIIKTKLLAQPQTDQTVFLHFYSTELGTALPPEFLYGNQLIFQQRKSLNAGLESIKSWFDVFFTITPADYSRFPFSIFSQLVYCTITLHRLTTLNNPRFDENGVLKAVDSLCILDRVINNLEQVVVLSGLDNSDSPERVFFSRSAQMFRSLRPGLEAKLGPDDLSTIPLPQNVNENFPPDALAFDFFDNDWLMDLFPSLNY